MRWIFFNKTASHKIDISLRDAVFVCVIKISETYNYDVTIVTIDTIEDEDPDYAAELLFDSLGYGVDKNGGILLLVAMESRDVVVFYDGIVDYDIADSIRESVTPYLTDGEYYTAFETYIDKCDYYLNGEINGYPFKFGTSLVVSIVIGLIVALIVTSVMKGQLKSVAFRRGAENYVTPGSLDVAVSRDTFLYSTLAMREKPKDNEGSSSSSGSRGSSSGKFLNFHKTKRLSQV